VPLALSLFLQTGQLLQQAPIAQAMFLRSEQQLGGFTVGVELPAEAALRAREIDEGVGLADLAVPGSVFAHRRVSAQRKSRAHAFRVADVTP